VLRDKSYGIVVVYYLLFMTVLRFFANFCVGVAEVNK
jgi:hypothetical protein